jgi:inner membrane transporter RhtA
MRTERSARPALLVVGAVVSVQLGAALGVQLFPLVGSTGAVAIRMLTAAVLVVAVARPRLRGVARRHLVLAAGFGVLLGLLNLTFYASLARIPLGVAVTLEFTGPLAVAVIGSRRVRDLAWAGLAAAAVVLLTGGGRALADGSLDPVGVALALLAGALWGGYIVVNQRVGTAFPGVQGLAIALMVAAVLVTPLGVASAGSALLDPWVLAAGAGAGVLSSALPWAFETLALRAITTSTFGVLMSLEPAAAALAGFFLLGERPSVLQWCAIALACVASAGAAESASSGRRTAQPADTPPPDGVSPGSAVRVAVPLASGCDRTA